MRVPFVRFAGNQLRLIQSPFLHRWMHRASTPMEISAEPAMVLAPHPDDETFGCGGMIGLKRDMHVPVCVVFLTDGTGSDPEMDPQALTRLRQGEALQAATLLGVAVEDIHFLDQPDNGLRHLPPDQRRALVRRLGDLLQRYRPAELYVPHHADRHPDHEAAYRLACDAIAESGVAPRILQYPIWLIWWGPLSLLLRRACLRGGCRLGVQAVQDRKNQAIQIYRSQLPTMPRGFLKQFTQGYELFFPDSLDIDAADTK